MFKPSENDPLVLEHGQSPFGVILAMKDITFASIVSDFAKLVESSPKRYIIVYVCRMSVYVLELITGSVVKCHKKMNSLIQQIP